MLSWTNQSLERLLSMGLGNEVVLERDSTNQHPNGGSRKRDTKCGPHDVFTGTPVGPTGEQILRGIKTEKATGIISCEKHTRLGERGREPAN